MVSVLQGEQQSLQTHNFYEFEISNLNKNNTVNICLERYHATYEAIICFARRD